MKREPFLKNFPNYLKMIGLIMIIFITWFVINVLSILISIPFLGSDAIKFLTGSISLDIESNINFYKFMQITNHLGMFLIPSLIFAFLIRGNNFKYFKINKQPKVFTLVSGILLIIVCLPFINWLMTINEIMKLPDFLSDIEEWMRKTENNATLVTNQFLNVKSYGGLIVNLLMVAIIPAVGEEFFFRGVLQKQFKEWFGNVHIAILITSLLFSAMHLQFFGFIPRFVLGMLLGYLFYFSNNLWIPILAHFFNNGLAVIIYYLNYNKITNTDIDKLGSLHSDYIIIIGSFIFSMIIMMSIYKKEHLRKRGIIKKEDL